MLSHKPLLDPAAPSAPAPRRRPRPPKRLPRLASSQHPAPASIPDPSSGILALLVTVAGSSSVDARPLPSDPPPDFLCPRLHAWALPRPAASSSAAQQQPPASYWEPCDAAEAAAFVDLSVRRKKRRIRPTTSNNIADKYIQGPDGRWRKADSWELYGSSSCSPSGCMDTPVPTEFPLEEDQVSPSAGTVTAASGTSTSPTLPAGWDKGKAEDTMTGMILALSLSLAVALIVFMMAIVRWRKKRHTRQERDAENSLDRTDTAESEELKRARSRQRLWAKASAKWVANVRQSARRRRKRMAATAAKDSDGRVLREAQASSSAVSLAGTHSAHDVDRRSSRAPSCRSARRASSYSRSPSPASSDRHRQRAESVAPESPSPSHPPAYLQSRSTALQHAYSRWRSHPLDLAPDSHHASALPPPDSPPPCSADRSPPPPLSPLPYDDEPVHSAHVAVDDKAVLARLAHLASAPPPAADDHHDHGAASPVLAGGSSEIRPSVPVLDDDDDPFEPAAFDVDADVGTDIHDSGHGGALERRLRPDRHPGQAHDASAPPHGSPPRGLGPRLLPSVPVDALALALDPPDADVPSYAEDVRRHPPLVLPPPPAKVPLTGPAFYEYPDEFERDVETVEPHEEPSAPPFGVPSSPPLEYASAPDADTDAPAVDAAYAHMMVPSAPPLEYADEALPEAEGLAPSAPPLDPDAQAEFPPAHVPSESSPSAAEVPEQPPGGVAHEALHPSSSDDQGNSSTHIVAPASSGSDGDADHREPRAEQQQHPEPEPEPAPPRYLP